MLHRYIVTFLLPDNKHYSFVTNMYYRNPTDVTLINPRVFAAYGPNVLFTSYKRKPSPPNIDAYFDHLCKHHQQAQYDKESRL